MKPLWARTPPVMPLSKPKSSPPLAATSAMMRTAGVVRPWYISHRPVQKAEPVRATIAGPPAIFVSFHRLQIAEEALKV